MPQNGLFPEHFKTQSTPQDNEVIPWEIKGLEKKQNIPIPACCLLCKPLPINPGRLLHVERP
jgi:hypothetical protein